MYPCSRSWGGRGDAAVVAVSRRLLNPFRIYGQGPSDDFGG